MLLCLRSAPGFLLPAPYFTMSIPQILYQGYIYGVPLAIAAAVFGFRWKEGFWGNVLALVNVMFSLLIAVGWWEDVAILFAKQFPKMLFFADAIAFWTIFVVSLLILMEATKAFSRVQVKFAIPVEKAGNGVALTLLFLAMYGIFNFASVMEPVGYPENATRNSDPVSVKMLRILSAGNLSSFTKPMQFDRDGNFGQNHLKRQQAIWNHYKTKEGSILYAESQIPPRRP